ncbi:hypothetical protein THIX_10033 [Thiomonas sp. X19]|nr:hypothetical protein THIX_10033 [Thiomonas sp. X19]
MTRLARQPIGMHPIQTCEPCRGAGNSGWLKGFGEEKCNSPERAPGSAPWRPQDARINWQLMIIYMRLFAITKPHHVAHDSELLLTQHSE